MTTFVTIIYVAVAFMLVLGILLQSGRGGGLGGLTGSSGQVFGAGGGSDIMAKLTQSFAALFVLCALYLAYDSAHSESSSLADASEEVEFDNDVPLEEVNWERVVIGQAALPLPPADAPAPKADVEAPEEETPTPPPAVDQAVEDKNVDDDAAPDANPGDAAPAADAELPADGEAAEVKAPTDSENAPAE